MFIPTFDVGVLCPTVSAGAAAAPGALVQGGALSAQALSGVNGAVAQTVTLDGDNMYNDSAAPNNCVGVCEADPFTGSPWTVPAPSHWYAAPAGAEDMGMAPAKALVAPVATVQLEAPAPSAAFGPQTKPAPDTEHEMGPLPKPAAVSLGLISVHAAPGKGNRMLEALEQVWNKQEHVEKAKTEIKGVRTTPGHVVMCGNALVLGAASSLWSWGQKTIKGEATSASSLAQEFKESASSNAEAVTPIGGHWLRHHVLKQQAEVTC